jgi:ribosome-associated translation inhibitor RaiA
MSGISAVPAASSSAQPRSNAKLEVGDVENDREFKAHIYQQLVELQPFLASDSQVAVVVEVQDVPEFDEVKSAAGKEAHESPLPSGKKEEIVLTLVTNWGEYKVEAEGRDQDLYSAFSAAKEKLKHLLDECYNSAIDSDERDAQIQNLLDGNALLH